MAVALNKYILQLDETLQRALDAYCTPENLERVIRSETELVLDQIIKEEVRNWFVHGEGRAIIKESVHKKLRDNVTYTPLDDET
jgi:hypothetical protein